MLLSRLKPHKLFMFSAPSYNTCNSCFLPSFHLIFALHYVCIILISRTILKKNCKICKIRLSPKFHILIEVSFDNCLMQLSLTCRLLWTQLHMNPLQAAPASGKHQDNQMEGIGAANNRCHLVIIEKILHLHLHYQAMCKRTQQLPTLMSQFW